MKSVKIFYGSKTGFEKLVPTTNCDSLTKMVMELDADSKVFILRDADKPIKEKEKVFVKNFVVGSNEYAGVREHVILNFANFIAKMDIENIFLHNPPLSISEQILNLFPETEVICQKYRRVEASLLKSLNTDYPSKIIGQESVKNQLLQALYPLTSSPKSKPIVILFYGDTGLGKTETANFICELLNEKLFRKQFSMFQNNQFATYLFGGAHFEMSFAKDLLDRESNVILLDEFDKANTTFHSAFYQLFDEGMYVDQNYEVELMNSIIICTSNYKTEDEIKKHLGNAIFSRFDAVIKFNSLSTAAKKQICKIQFDKQINQYSKEEMEKILKVDIEERLIDLSQKFDNAREIFHLVQNTFSQILLTSVLNED